MRASAYTATHHKPPSFRSRSKTRRTGAWAWAAAVTLVVPLIAAAPFDAREAKADIAGGAGVPPANDLYNYALDMYTEVVFGGQTFWVAGVGDEGYGQLYTPWDPDDLYLLQKDWPAGDARYKTAYSATGSNSYNESLLRQKLKAIEDGLTAAERGVLLPFADDLVWTPYSGGAKNVSAKPDTVPRYEYSGDYDYFFVQPLTRRLDVWWSGPYSGHLYDPDREKRVAIMSYGQSDNKWWGANAVAAGIGQCRQTWSNYEYTSEGEAYYPCPVSVDTALSTELPVRPALALDLSKVRAYSPVGSGYNTRSKAGLDPVTKNVAADAKFEKYGFPSSYRGAVKLIMETGELGLELRARPDGLAAGKKIDLFYDNASTGSNMYVSATVTGLNGTFYQKLKRIGDSPRGKVTVDFAGVPEGNYNVELSAEQVNGDKQADFVSPPQVFMVTLDAAGTAVIAQTGDIVLDEAPPSLDGVSLDVAAGTVVLDFSETMGLDWNPRVTVDKEGDPQGAEVAGTWDRSRQVFTVSKQLEAEANYLVTVKGSAAAPIPDLVGNAVAGVMQKQLQTADRDRFSISYAGVKAVGQPPDSARVGARVEVRVIASCWEAEEVFRGTYSRVDRYGNTVLGGVPLVFEGWSYGGEYDLNCYRRYSWTMPQGDVELYSQVVEPGDVELVVEESPGLGGKLSAYYAKPHTIVTLTGSDTSDSRVTGAVLWEATLAPDGSYTKDAELETISFGSRSSAIFAAPLVPAGKVVLVALTGEEKPRNKVVFPGERNVDGVPVSLEPVDPSGWTLEADGFWSTDQHAAGRFVMFEVKASEPNYAVTALGLTRSYESLPFTWTEIQVDNTYKGSVQFYMPAFTSTRDWVDRPVNLSLSLRRVPVALRVSAVVPDKAIWESVSGFRVTGRGLEQVLGRGRDYASFSPEKRDLLSTVTLKHNGKTAYISQATGRWPGFTLNDDGSLTVPLPDHLKEIIGDPVSDVFYLSIGGVEKPVLIYRDYRARVQPYSVLGIAKERDFLSYSVVMGDTVEDL
ncbi:MAG: hypothetical protein LBC97_08245, partial [Bifidobacteriaceae bacterium]|nr:hypothetical protein [Bifidobacteriaceae bacterium]